MIGQALVNEGPAGVWGLEHPQIAQVFGEPGG